MGGKYLGNGRATLGLNENSELIRRNILVLMNTGLDVPAFEVAAVATGKGTSAKPTDRSSLPIPIVDDRQLGLFAARILQRLADRPPPCNCGNIVARRHRKRADD